MTEEALAFDTHATVKRLVKHGFSDKQAEGIVAIQVELINSQLATKKDVDTLHKSISALRQETKKDIKSQRLETQRDLAATAEKTIQWVAGFAVTIIAVLLTALARILHQRDRKTAANP